MAIIEKNIKSNCDGLNLGITIVTPAKNRKINGIVQLIHGMSEHRKRYLPFMNFLAKKGYVSIIHDHRGHGESVKNNKDLGYFYDKSANYIVEDTHQITELIKKEYPDKDVILFGHSMGSLVLRNYIQKYDEMVDKLILCGSPSYTKKAWLGLIMVTVLEKIKGPLYRSEYIQNLIFKNYYSKFKDKNWMFTNKEETIKYKKDKKCGFTLTLNGFKNLFKLLIRTYNKKRYLFNNKELKILFISGAEDPVMITEDDFFESCDFLRNIGYDVNHILYKDKRHDLLSENIKEIVYEDILEFIKEN